MSVTLLVHGSQFGVQGIQGKHGYEGKEMIHPVK